MATENLPVPEEHLEDVIKVIRMGIKQAIRKGGFKMAGVCRQLESWCKHEEEYLKRLKEE